MNQLTWNEDASRDRLNQRAARRLLAVAVAFQSECKQDLSKSNPAPHTNPAPKGQHPRGRTWNLRDSVVVDPPDLAAIAKAGRVRVGVLKGAEYGYFLWKRGWLGIHGTLERVRGKLSAILGRPP